jgi:cell division control protein CDC15
MVLCGAEVVKMILVSPQYVELDGTLALDCLVGGFMLPKVSNLESTLDSYLKLMSTNKKIVDRMLKSSVINHIMLKLKIHNKNPVVQLTLLRILKLFISYAYDADLLEPLNISRGIAGALDTLRSKSSSLLVEELISEIFSFL